MKNKLMYKFVNMQTFSRFLFGGVSRNYKSHYTVTKNYFLKNEFIDRENFEECINNNQTTGNFFTERERTKKI